MNRGNYYFRHGDMDKTESDFKKSIEMEPDYIPAYSSLALIYGKEGKFKEAISLCDKALEIPDPSNFMTPKYSIYYFRAMFYDRLGDHQHALNDYNMAVELQQVSRNGSI